MADELPAFESKLQKNWKRYAIYLTIASTIFSGGSVLLVQNAANWLEMNFRPIDVVNAADLAPELLTQIHDNQDDIDALWEYVCAKHPKECE